MYPNCGIKRPVRVTIHTQGDHPVALGGPFIDTGLMAAVGNTVISLKRRSQASCGSRSNAREPNVNPYELHTDDKYQNRVLLRNALMDG